MAIFGESNPLQISQHNVDKILSKHFPLLSDMRDGYFASKATICSERAALLTSAMAKNDRKLFKKLASGEEISSLERADVFAQMLAKKRAIVWHEGKHKDKSPFAGSTTTKRRGVPIYPEAIGLALWPELAGEKESNVSIRKENPYVISKEDLKKLEKVFPEWVEFSIMELARPNCPSQMKLLEALRYILLDKPVCITHTIPDFEEVIKLGFKGLAKKATGLQTDADETSKNQYQAFSRILEALSDFSLRLSKNAKELADATSTSSDDKKRLNEIATVYKTVATEAPTTLREGLTVLWLCWMALHQESPNIAISLGRLDQFLYPLYQEDKKKNNGADDLDFYKKTVELFGHFWLKLGDHVPMVPISAERLFGGSGSNQAVTIGGIERELDSNDKPVNAVNELTYAILDATTLLRLRDPNLNARYHSDEVHGDKYIKRLVDANISTHATPAIHNDRAVIESLISVNRKNGSNDNDVANDARDYGIVGCVEPVSVGRSFTASGAIFINLPAALELALNGGKLRDAAPVHNSPAKGHFSNIEELKAGLEHEVNWLANEATILNNEFGKVYQKFYKAPILSTFFKGTWSSGKDVMSGGATYNASGVTIIGLTDVVDSIAAIDKVVYKDERMKFADFKEYWCSDFSAKNSQNCEMSGIELQALLSNSERTPKFGDHKDALPIACDVAEIVNKAFHEKEHYRQGDYRVGFWSMTTHAGLGRLMKASPNGRSAKAPFPSGITPVSNVTPNLTEVLNSIATIPVTHQSNGAALNIKFTPPFSTPGEYDKVSRAIKAYVKTFFSAGPKKIGGMEIQFNVTHRQDFLDAIVDESRHPELLVRVSGYTAMFVDLNKQMKRELIERTEYQEQPSIKMAVPTPVLPGIPEGVDEQQINEHGQRIRSLLALYLERRLSPDELLDGLLQGLELFLRVERTIHTYSRLNPLSWLDRYWNPFSKLFNPDRLLYNELKGFTACITLIEKQDEKRKNPTGATVVFRDGAMKVYGKPWSKDQWKEDAPWVQVTFADKASLRDYIITSVTLPHETDPLRWLLENKIEVEGNLNLIYRFGYLASELLARVSPQN